GDVASGAGHAYGSPVGTPLHHASPRPDPVPVGAFAAPAGAVFGQEQRHLAPQVPDHRLTHLFPVFGVDRLVAADDGADGDVGARTGGVGHLHALDLARSQVVVPELLP